MLSITLNFVTAVISFVTFVLGCAMAYFSYRIYSSFPYAAVVFSPLYVLSGLVITRSVVNILQASGRAPVLMSIISEILLLISFAVLVYMFYSLRGKVFEVFQPYKTTVLISGLPSEVEAKVSVDISQILSVKPNSVKILDLTAGVHEVSVPMTIETREGIYDCKDNIRRIKPGINLVSFEYTKRM